MGLAKGRLILSIQMACCALTSNLRHCRNWSMLDNVFCHTHKDLTKEERKDRWFQRYILAKRPEFSVYLHNDPLIPWHKRRRDALLKPLLTGEFSFTKEDVRKIPGRRRYIDVYLLLLEYGFVKQGTHKALENLILWHFCETYLRHQIQNVLVTYISDIFILSSGDSFYEFLLWIAGMAMSRGGQRFTGPLLQLVPTLLDTPAAKELSWVSREKLDSIRIAYEKTLGKEHPLTRCLVQRWLLDLKELYQTEKAIQKIKMDHCKEELMMNRWHPQRLEKYLNMGYSIEALDDIM